MQKLLDRLLASKPLKIGIIIVLVLSCGFTWIATKQDYERAYAATSLVPSTVSFEVGELVFYDNHETNLKTADGNWVYCATPELRNPEDGTYSTTSPAYNSEWESMDWISIKGENRIDWLRAIVWFGFGGPGFDKDMFPSTWYDGTAMTSADYYVLTHIAISYVWNGSTDDATYNCTDEFNEYVRRWITGTSSVDGSVVYPDAFATTAYRNRDEVPSTDQFQTYTIGGNGRQVVVGFAYQPYGYLEIEKSSDNTTITAGNDCYTLKGAVYTVYDSDGNTVGTLTTDEDGNTSTLELEPGTYTIKETSAPEGYYKDNNTYTVTITANETSTLEVDDTPANDPISLLVGKYDGEKTYYGDVGNLPQGSASLAHAEFTIEYYDTLNYDSYDEMTEAGIEPTRSWIVATNEKGYANLSEDYLVSGDALYYDNDGNEVLPRGTVVIYESKAPTGYILNDEVSFQKIQEEPADELVTYNTVETPEQVYRSDFELGKKADNGSSILANVPFKVTSTTTGESHVIVTDENGYFSSESSWNAHTNNTNGNDWAADYDGVIDSDELDNTAGIWFGCNLIYDDEGNVVQGDDLEVNDSLGALPYGTYTIEELRCTNNEGYALVSTTVTINRDGVVVDLGTLTDSEPEISTIATDALDGDNYVGVGEVTINDRVSYSHLVAGETYTLSAQLYDAETGEAIEVNGEPVVGSTTFTAEKSYGAEDVELTLETWDLVGKTLVVYETLTDEGGAVLCEHADVDDADQQVTVLTPEIGTRATDGVDGDQNVVTDSETTIVDTVSYRGLTPGEEYTITGTLMVKSYDEEGNVTEEELNVDGEPVTATTTFTPEESSGTVEVTFTFDSTTLNSGTELVVFEKLYLNEYELAVHADITDENQTVTLYSPEITTYASDADDGDKTLTPNSSTTIVDAVTYSNVVPGEKYTTAGILMNASTGLPLIAEDAYFAEDYQRAFLEDASSALGLTESGDDGQVATVDMDKLETVLDEYASLLDCLVIQYETFTAEKQDGTVSLEFEFNSNYVIDSSSNETIDTVVFEILLTGAFDDETPPLVVAQEADIDNQDQTVSLTQTSEDTGSFYSKTGGNTTIIVIAIVVLLALAAGCGFYFHRRKVRAAQLAKRKARFFDKIS